MLEIRPNCETCGKDLPNGSPEAMICTYECTFCKDCVDNLLQNVCPNCGGGFERRPTRPKEELKKNPGQTVPLIKPVNKERHKKYLERYKNVDPNKR